MSNINFFRVLQSGGDPIPQDSTQIMIASLYETTIAWSNITTSVSTPNNAFSPCSPAVNGLLNSQNIIAQSGFTNGAAKYCLDLTTGGYSDWYLGTGSEVTYMNNGIWANSGAVRDVINDNGGDNPSNSAYYWSSNQDTITTSKASARRLGASTALSKVTIQRVRAQKTIKINPTTSYSVGDLAFGGVIFRIDQLTNNPPC
jgi:hypothetical protein